MRDVSRMTGVFLCACVACVLHNYAFKSWRDSRFVKMAQSKTLDSVVAKAVRAFQGGSQSSSCKIMDFTA